MTGAISIVFGLLVGASQTQTSIFDQVIKKPTGDNGYEEYCRACDLLPSPPPSSGKKEPAPAPDPNVLESRRARVSKLYPVFDLVASGNRKKVFDPRSSIDFNTTYPEMAKFKEIGRLFADRIYVQFADGNGSGACSSFIESIKFSGNIADKTLISVLLRNAMRSTVEWEMLPHLGAISLADAARIESFFESQLKSQPKIIAAVQSEWDLITSLLPKLLEKPDDFMILTAAQKDEFKAMDDSARQKLASELRQPLNSYYGGLITMLKSQESDWRFPELPRLSGTAQVVLESLTPAFDQVVAREVQDRTRMRLWRLAMRIQQFRWIRNRLPKDLAELEAPELIHDPTNGGEFVYKAFEMQFEISSRGSSMTGPIKMGRVIPPSGDSGL
ncbi:MAG: hypothetical protein U0R49_07615 [Fimbriimonadales bacterium]